MTSLKFELMFVFVVPRAAVTVQAVDPIELTRELESVTDWVTLGILLGVPRYELQEISLNQVHVQTKRLRMLDSWMKNAPDNKRTWTEVVHALKIMKELELANTISLKHGEKRL